MIITKDMPVSGIISSWKETEEVFKKYSIPFDSNKALKQHSQSGELNSLIADLNEAIDSSELTCIEGG